MLLFKKCGGYAPAFLSNHNQFHKAAIWGFVSELPRIYPPHPCAASLALPGPEKAAFTSAAEQPNKRKEDGEKSLSS